jgi:hypothetical protein
MRITSFYKLLAGLLLLAGCTTTQKIQQHYTFEDKQVFDLIDRLNKNAQDKEAEKLLPEAYEQALDTRNAIKEANNGNLTGGDQHMSNATSWQVIQKMYEAIVSSPAAHKIIPNPVNASAQMQQEYSLAAQEYYNDGVTFLSYNSRQYAQMAYDAFAKANKAVPGYKDVAQLMAVANEKALIKVVVNPVNYYNNNYSYWGFNSDFLQDQMVRDLNFRAYSNVKFYTNWQASSLAINADKVVDLNFTNINIGTLSARNYNYQRSAQIQTGSTKSIPPQPVYETVYATVYVSERSMQSFATLQCRIYNTNNNGNILYDNFPSTYNWTYSTARYSGDSRALQPQDWALINNNNIMNTPGRNSIAEQLIRNSYNMLISRINSNVRFSE